MTSIGMTAQSSVIIEQTEIAAWKDLLDAAPASFRSARGLGYKDIGGGTATNFQKLPIPLFNRVIGLGLTEPLTKKILDEIKSFYTHGEKYLIHYSVPMEPDSAESLLKHNDFSVGGAWERITRDNAPLRHKVENPRGLTVKLVDDTLKERWVHFLIDTYGFDFYEWPASFARRAGWRHYIVVDSSSRICACRSFHTSDTHVWSGVDAPVPGVMTPDCNPDFLIWERAVQDLIRDGATLFVADIELPDMVKNRDAYEGFKSLGFEIPYTRHHYSLNKFRTSH